MAIATVNFFSRCLMRQVTINAVIPAGSFHMPEGEKKPFKTMYLLHGIFGNYTDWITGTRIAPQAEQHNLAVIMPSGDNSFYTDHIKSSAMYGEYFGRELVEVTRELFNLSKKREDTFIAGLSMGGYGALRNGLKYHKTFSKIAALSGALIIDHAVNSNDNTTGLIGRRSYYESIFGDLDKLIGSDNDPKALLNNLIEKDEDIPEIYIACGTEDHLLDVNREYAELLKLKNIKHTYVEGPGGHSWDDYWDEYILKVLKWLPLD